MTINQKMQLFVRLLTDHQSRLYAYILTSVGDADAAGDILQDTNLVLWEKWEQAMGAGSFTAWAYGVARHKVLTYAQRKGRDRLVFDASMLDLISTEAVRAAEETGGRIGQLKHCIETLPEHARKALTARYEGGKSLGQIAELIGRSVTATTQLLYRTRVALLECMETAETGRKEHP
ncbi:MAG: sigma-70 family RNA polymerase sigma factor [Planctomycetes bacterium]|nr:sigma-70 family RNA polymerase sigma factor [Planctomycetota bacterium]